MIAIYAGTFDPITYGHIDIIERASKMFDKIIVVIGKNSEKKNLFTDAERLDMTKVSLNNINNVEVVVHTGLTVDIARKLGARAMIRGIRTTSDFNYENQIAQVNRKLDEEIQTILMFPDEKYAFVSSSIVREIASYGEDVTSFVNEYVSEKIKIKFNVQSKLSQMEYV
jgi:pantetheine-phosphate adenylyltransferase